MKLTRLLLGVCVMLFVGVAQAEEENPLDSMAWEVGPTTSSIGGKATIKVPKGFVFLGAEDTKKFMELNQNPSSGNEFMIAPGNLEWFAIFEFDPVGYVKDDETIEAEPLLDAVKKGSEQSNEERRRRGWGTLSIVGWRFKPQYDRETKLLEWAFLARDDASGQDVINYNTRLLGRTGVMQVVLVADPAILDTSV